MSTIYKDRQEILFGRVMNQQLPSYHESDIVHLNGSINGAKSVFSISNDELSQHSLFLGGTGTGKTNAMYYFVEQIKSKLKEDDALIIFDTKGDFYKKFYQKGDYVIGNSNMYSLQSQKWNIFKEIVSDTEWDEKKMLLNTREIADSLLYEEYQSSKEIFFPDAAKEIITAIVFQLLLLSKDDAEFRKENLFNDKLVSFLNDLSPKLILQFLQGSSDYNSVCNYLGDGSSKQSLGIMGTITNVIKKLFVGVFADHGFFSIGNFVNNRGGKSLFIEYDMSIGSTLIPLYRLLYDLALKHVLSQSTNKGSVYFILDEFRLLPDLKYIQDAINFGRSFGVKVIAGIQNMPQLYDAYGEQRGQSIISGFSSLFVFRSNDPVTRQYVVESSGKNEVLDTIRIRNEYKQERRRGNVIEDWDIMNLKIGECIITLPMKSPFSFQFFEYKKGF